MSLWDILLPGGGSRKADYGNGKVGYVSPDAWRIREGDEVYHFDGEKGGDRKPSSWKVTRVYSPSEAQRQWPRTLPSWPSPDYRAPYKYPVLELDGSSVWSAAEAVLEDTINKIYGR
jgi:hypothetical protein